MMSNETQELLPAVERFNFDMFRRVIARMEAEPECVFMHRVLAKRSCGTVGCIAGHTALEAHPGARAAGQQGDNFLSSLYLPDGSRRRAVEVATEALGLTEDEGNQLFFNYASELCELEEGTPEHAAAAVRGVKQFVQERTEVAL
jgi:hypothetical protein